jgi:hypothetical protein
MLVETISLENIKFVIMYVFSSMDEKGKTESQTRKEGRLELFKEFADN